MNQKKIWLLKEKSPPISDRKAFP